MTLTHTPSLMEKLLGSWYKWWYLAYYSFKISLTYRWNSIMWLGSSVMVLAGTLLVWYINSKNGSNFDSDFSQIFTYLIIGEAFIFSSAIQFDVGENIQDGKIATKLLTPVSTFKFYIVRAFGYQLFENLSKLFIYLGAGIAFNNFLILPNLNNFVLFSVFLAIALLINMLLGLLVGLSAFWFTAFFGPAAFIDNTRLIFSGRFFPLNVLNFLKITLLLPFAFTFYHPMQIYLGKYDTNQTILVFLGGLFWCVVLYLLAKLVFKLGLKRNESVGL